MPSKYQDVQCIRQDYDQDDAGPSRYVKICCNYKVKDNYNIKYMFIIFAYIVVLADSETRSTS